MNELEFKAMVKKAIAATIKQGKPSLNGTHCVYGSPNNNLRCVVGHMMDDEEFAKFRDVFTNVRGLHRGLGFKPSLTLDQLRLLYTLQQCHDSYSLDGADGEFKDYFITEVKHKLGDEYVTDNI